MIEYYLPILTFHIISVLSWMAVLFYLPRLYVYHQENSDKKEFIEIVKIQELKLYKYIGLPAMWGTILSGGLLIYSNPDLLNPWLYMKLILVFLLTIYSLSLEYFRKRLEIDKCKKNGKFFRAYNEVPTILSILIVTFVVMKTIPLIFSISITLFFIFIMYMIVKEKKETITDNNG